MRKSYLSRNKLEDPDYSTPPTLTPDDFEDGGPSWNMVTSLVSSPVVKVSLSELQTIYSLSDVVTFWEIIDNHQQAKYL